MKIRLSDKEAASLLGATLMHWGVPFRRTARRPLTEHQQSIVDEASDRLIDLREAYQRTDMREAQEVLLSDQEAALLIAVVEDCLKECGNDATELHLHLQATQPSEVETLLERIRASLGAQFAKPA